MKRLQDLVAILEAQYQRAQQLLRPFTEKEQHIRAELATLQDHVQSARELSPTAEPEMRALGADIAWEKWLERSKANLNLELATVLASKAMYLDRVRKCFGKLQVANAKLAQINLVERKKSQIQALEKTISIVVSEYQ